MTGVFADWQTQQAELRANALSYLDSSQPLEPIHAAVLEALRKLAGAKSILDRDTFLSVGMPAIVRALQQAGYSDWGIALEARADVPHIVIEPKLAAIEILIGRACGKLCGDDPCEDSFVLVRNLRDVIPFSSEDFLTEAYGATNASDDAKKALATTFRQRAADYPNSPERVAHIYSGDRRRLIANGRDERFVDVWDGPPRVAAIHIHDVDAYELLRRVDHASYLDLVETHPLKELTYWVVEYADRYATTPELCQLLRDARAVFDDQNEWVRENRVAFLVLNALGDRLLRHFTLDAASDDPSAEFKETLEHIIEALITRADAIPLAYAWFQHLAMSAGNSSRPGVRAKVDKDAPRALLYVATNLAAHLGPRPHHVEWVAAELDVWRNYRIYTLLAFELCRKNRDVGAITGIIEQVLLRDLVSSYGLDRLLGHPTVDRFVIGNAVAHIPDTVLWFRQLWGRLFWQRDRARFFHASGQIPPNVGQVVVFWALCGLDMLDAGSEQARTLWVELEQAIREGSLTDVFRQHNDAWSQALRFLGGCRQKTFPEDPAPGTPGALEDFVAPWLHIDSNFAMLLIMLYRSGLSASRLRDAVSSGEMLRIVTRETKGLGHSLFSDEDIASILSLADEIDGQNKQIA